MAEWPDEDELKRVLDIDSDDWDTTVERVLAAAIAKVKGDVGAWDEDNDEPDDSLAQAALRMGELMSLRPNALPGAVAQDPTYQRLLSGHRKAFGIA
jgi:hypothetical protein